MKVLEVRNVNTALPRGLNILQSAGLEEPSRNGAVLVMPYPVITKYLSPTERVLFCAQRDANPFFHLFESLWMLAGRNDVAFVKHYAAQMELYSDDNETLNGAYGFRWREHFGYDQLDDIIGELKKNPASRRCVLAMWDAVDYADVEGIVHPYEGDLKFGMSGGKDIPCNTHCYFRAIGDRLDMTVCNRSNDVVWGAYGANAVHFSVLQEYVASAAGLQVGTLYQLSNNYHVYSERTDVKRLLEVPPEALVDDRYAVDSLNARARTTPVMIGRDRDVWDRLCQEFVAAPNEPYSARWGDEPLLIVAHCMAHAHRMHKEGETQKALKYLVPLATAYKYDWYIAGVEWLQRRADKKAAA